MRELHAWNVTPQEARQIQRRLIPGGQRAELDKPLRLVAGADVSYHRGSPQMYAGVVVVHVPDMVVVEEVVAVAMVTFPYIPGLLSFREAPALLQAFRQITAQPDVVIVDGQGIAHPQRMGIAAHVGLCLDVPTIGCAKSWLTGRYEAHTLSETAGATTPLIAEDGSIIGAVVRTKTRTQPVFVSPGHQLDVETAVSVVLQSCKGYKLPEPIRLAHLLVNRARKTE